ncbi:Hypothetical predicted protein [Octopus vulgaris]|uniref:Uncharacterized protein n=1 Tax=Octopus vulgaris TaxID=6645 RepID=A0AA36F9C9_OCTVU|nr:Hypothetical predicted protein [Octopus vulgaris]
MNKENILSSGKMTDEGSPSRETIVGSPTEKTMLSKKEMDASKLKTVTTVSESSPSGETEKGSSPSKEKKNEDKTKTYNFAAAAGRKTEEIKMEEIEFEKYKTMFKREGNSVIATLPQEKNYNIQIVYYKGEKNRKGDEGTSRKMPATDMERCGLRDMA